MGLGKLFRTSRPREGAELRTAGSTFEAILKSAAVNGLSPMSRYRGALQVPGAWRASVMLSGLLGRMPWHAYTDHGGGPARRVYPTPLLLEQPNPPDTRITTFSSWALDFFFEGNAVGIVAARNASNWPTAIFAVPASVVGVRRITEGMWSALPIGEIEYSVGTMTFSSRDIFHVKGPCEPGALRGMGVLENHMRTIELAKAQQDQAASVSRHGVPTGVLKSQNPDLNEPEARALKAKWLESQQQRTIAVLNASTDFKPLSWNPEELELVEARKFTLTELELIFGLPVGWLGGQTSSRTYSNIEQDAVNLLKFTLDDPVTRFEEELSRHQPRGTWTRANPGVILRTDTLTRYQAHQIGIAAGFLRPNEARELEDLEPVDGLDEAWLSKQGQPPEQRPPIRGEVVDERPRQIEAGPGGTDDDDE